MSIRTTEAFLFITMLTPTHSTFLDQQVVPVQVEPFLHEFALLEIRTSAFLTVGNTFGTLLVIRQICSFAAIAAVDFA